MLLDNAKEKDVEIRRGIGVREVLFDGDTATGVCYAAQQDGTPRKPSRQPSLWDSTGQRSLIGRQLNLNTTEPNLKMASLFTHYEGGHRDVGIDEGATLILHTEAKDSWFWSIPLPYNRTSIGVVGGIRLSPSESKEMPTANSMPKKFSSKNSRNVRHCNNGSKARKQLFPIQTTKDFSYRASRIAGNNWVLVGGRNSDFLDPVYSTGLFSGTQIR